MPNLFLDKDEHAQLLNIFEHCCPNAIIWAYGSRIHGKAHTGSDLDLAMIDFGANALTLPMIRAVIDESTITFRVDLHIFHHLPPSFQNEIKKHHLLFFPRK